MILDLMLGMVTNTIMLLLNGLPNIPPLDSTITNSVQIITNYASNAVGFVSYLFTPPLLIFILTTSIILINFSVIYNTVMWVLRKIPFIAID